MAKSQYISKVFDQIAGHCHSSKNLSSPEKRYSFEKTLNKRHFLIV